MKLHGQYVHFQTTALKSEQMGKDPLQLFCSWLQQAIDEKAAEVNAMVLATASKKGRPSSRTVLLKEVDSQGLIFFTNYSSRKAHQMEENPFASVTLYWKECMRQVSIEGSIEKISQEASKAYFKSRPRESQISAWASKQSTPIESREALLDCYKNYQERFKGKDVPLPPFWGGYRLIPEQFFFWQGHEGRLHDRFHYEKDTKGHWQTTRLAP